ncbi:Re/Si-specific NAD(P)(+) transhydrogenase subunit alpha [Thermostilla marina]
MIVGILKETFPGERRTALIPAQVPALTKAGFTVRVERGAGTAAGFPDEEYQEKGAELVDRSEVLAADILLAIRWDLPEAEEQTLRDSIAGGKVLIGTWDPLLRAEKIKAWAEKGVTLFALELLPRITRAQSMDILSSMATLAGYRAVLLAAEALPKIFPMMMTAAGTLAPAKVFIVGAGVAGLQAISTARRLGAVVSAYDVRPAVKEQVESLGGKFVEIELENQEAEDQGGYAKELGEEFYRKQREMMLRVVAESDVVITTAAIPGKKAPLLVTKEMVAAMRPGSVIVDLAAERGGNCELTKAGETVVENGVTIIGPVNLPSAVPYHGSQMFSKNVQTFLANMTKDGKLEIDTEDEIIRDTLVARDGKIVNERVLERLNDA